MSSSTFSSKHVPWGAVWAIAIVVAVELALRLAPAGLFFMIEQHDYKASDTQDYTLVNAAIDTLPAPTVAIIGSSRAREAVDSPTLRDLLQRSLGRSVDVRNYGVAAGRIDVSLALVQRLAAQNKLPRVVVLAIDASDFRDLDPVNNRYRFVSLRTLFADIRRHGVPTEDDMTEVLGNSWPLRSVTLRHVVQFLLFERQTTSEFDPITENAALGGSTAWVRMHQQQVADGVAVRSLLTQQSKRLRKRRRSRLKRVIRSYLVRRPRVRSLNALVNLALQHGVVVVIAETPVPPIVVGPKVNTARTKLYRELARLQSPGRVYTMTAEALEREMGDEHFFDQSHVNGLGAKRFTEAIALLLAQVMREFGD